MVVYNPRASHHVAIEEEVLARVRQLSGWMVAKYAVKHTSYDDNVVKLQMMLADGDLVISAGGDGTASIALNAVMAAGKDVTLAVLGYGNFNDIARMLGVTREEGVEGILQRYEAGKMRELHPLEIEVNGKHWRYAPCYFSMGLLAQATTMLEEPKVRKVLDTGRKGTMFSLMNAVRWYLKHHKRNYLPAGKLNGTDMPRKTTDYMAVNGPTLARIMKGGDWWMGEKKFGSTVAKLGGFWRMVGFGLKSITKGVELQETEEDVIEFDTSSEVEVHAEGEYEDLRNVKMIKIEKSEKSVKVICDR